MAHERDKLILLSTHDLELAVRGKSGTRRNLLTNDDVGLEVQQVINIALNGG